MIPNPTEMSADLDDPSVLGAYATLTKWTKAVATGRIEDVLKLYADDAILVPTLSDDIVFSEDGRRRYFEFFLADSAPTCVVDQEKLRVNAHNGTIAIGGIYTFCFQRETVAETVAARFLFVFEKSCSDWLITGHHSSRCM